MAEKYDESKQKLWEKLCKEHDIAVVNNQTLKVRNLDRHIKHLEAQGYGPNWHPDVIVADIEPTINVRIRDLEDIADTVHKAYHVGSSKWTACTTGTCQRITNMLQTGRAR